MFPSSRWRFFCRWLRWHERDPLTGAQGEPVVFTDHFPPRPLGRARFVPADTIPADECPDVEYPLVLITGRQLEHWHTGSLYARADEGTPEGAVFVAFCRAEAAINRLTNLRLREQDPGVQVLRGERDVRRRDPGLRQSWAMASQNGFVGDLVLCR